MQLCLANPLVFHKWTAAWIPFLLAVATHSNPQHLNSSCDQHYDKVKSCCNECRPGFYVASPCTESKSVDCKPCEKGEYLEHSNSQAECFKQIECDEKKGFEVLRKGDTVTATQCVCTAGSHCSQDCEYCLKDNPCHPGYGVTQKANRESDTVCERCPPMHFSEHSSLIEKCKQWTNCTALGLIVEVNGNMTSDVVCTYGDTISLPRTSTADELMWGVAMGLACGFGLIVTLIFAIVSHGKIKTIRADCVQLRFAVSWCRIRRKKRNQGSFPVDPLVNKLANCDMNQDTGSELFLAQRKPMKTVDKDIFYLYTEAADCSCSLDSCSGEIPHSDNLLSSRPLGRNPGCDCYNRSRGNSSDPALHEDPYAVIAAKRLQSSESGTEESIHSNPSTQESAKRVSTARFRDTQEQIGVSGQHLNTPATFRLTSKESDKDRVSKCDCHISDGSDFSASSQTFESIDGNTSYNAGTGYPHPENDECDNSGSPCSSKTTHTTSVLKSVLNVNGSVIFNVIVKVNHTAELDSRGNVSAACPMEEDSTDNSEGKEGFPVKEENAQSEFDLNTNLGFPVQEQYCKQPVTAPMQEGQVSRERWKESPRFTSQTIKQETSRDYEENAVIPVQEEGKSEHLSNEEQSK